MLGRFLENISIFAIIRYVRRETKSDILDLVGKQYYSWEKSLKMVIWNFCFKSGIHYTQHGIGEDEICRRVIRAKLVKSQYKDYS